MDCFDNNGQRIGFLKTIISSDKSVTINQIRNVTTISVRDRNSGKVATEILIGDHLLDR